MDTSSGILTTEIAETQSFTKKTKALRVAFVRSRLKYNSNPFHAKGAKINAQWPRKIAVMENFDNLELQTSNLELFLLLPN